MLTAPNSISDSVIRLRDCIGVSSQPVFVDVVPALAATPHECHPNVAAHVKSYGGIPVHGWCVWEYTGFIIEGVFHSVWQSPDGKLTDITPHRDGETRILFIPDTLRVPDGSLIDNIRVPLADTPEVHHTIRLQKAIFAVRKHYSNSPTFGALLDAIEDATLSTDACPCQSGRPFSDCHIASSLKEKLAAWRHLF